MVQLSRRPHEACPGEGDKGHWVAGDALGHDLIRTTKGARSSGHEVTGDPVVAGAFSNCIGGLQAGQDRRFDTSCIDARVGPVPGEEQVVIPAFVRSETIAIGTRKGLHVAVRRVDVGPPILRIKQVRAFPTSRATEEVPAEAVVAGRSG